MSPKELILIRLQEMGASPKRSLGQNFLINELVIERIVSEVLRVKSPQVVEIGPGLGALTEPMLELNLRPLLIELDREFAQYWVSRGLNVIEADALKWDWQANLRDEPTTLVSNLPYQISSSLVIERALGPKSIGHMVLMFQREVADRILAKPQTKAYGLLSVVSQYHFKIRKLVDARAQDFFPRPQISSRVLVFERNVDAKFGPGFLKFVKAAFQQRRKLLTKNISGLIGKRQLNELPERLLELGHSNQVRAEELSVEDFANLYGMVGRGD